MPSARKFVLLVLAAAIAAGTGLYAKAWIGAERARAIAGQKTTVVAAPAEERTQVLVAARKLALGSFVKTGDLRWQAWPAESVSDSYIVKGGTEAPEPIGAVVRQTLNAGQPLTPEAVVRSGERGFLAAVLKAGFRAVSVPVNATTGISGFVFPGDRVDVLLALRTRGTDDGGQGETRYLSSTLLEGVRVLAVDQVVEKKGSDVAVAKTATLEVTPKQAEKIALALEMGALSFSLNSLAADELAEEIPMETASGESSRGSLTLDAELIDPRTYLGARPASKPSLTILRAGKAETASF
jgi:pilus assembly protein CpaB